MFAAMSRSESLISQCRGCGGKLPSCQAMGTCGLCPQGTFPAAWPDLVQLVREVSPSTIICPGPDCFSHARSLNERTAARYPVWFPCSAKFGGSAHNKLGVFHRVADPSTCIGHAAASKGHSKPTSSFRGKSKQI